MINVDPFKGPNIRIPIIIPMKGQGFVHHGFTLGLRVWVLGVEGSRV